jgi:hypothetical protein
MLCLSAVFVVANLGGRAFVVVGVLFWTTRIGDRVGWAGGTNTTREYVELLSGATETKSWQSTGLMNRFIYLCVSPNCAFVSKSCTFIQPLVQVFCVFRAQNA